MAKVLGSPLDFNFKVAGGVNVPRAIIEANAGTGKTYTIVGLFLRLILEKNMKVDQILVVTFTNKAAAELRERILESLRKAKEELIEDQQKPEDPFMAELLERIPKRTESLLKVNQAILNFDDSQISTIHGFCQKVLREEALTAGSSFEVEVSREDSHLEQAVEDFWREFVDENSNSEAGRYKLEVLYGFKKNNRSASAHPSTLKSKLSDLFQKPYASVEGEVLPDVDNYLDDILKLREKLKRHWNEDLELIKRELTQSDLSGYTENAFNKWSKAVEEFNRSSLNEVVCPKKIEKLSWSHLQNADLKKGKSKRPKHCQFFELVDQYLNLISKLDQVKTTIFLEAFNKIKSRGEELKSDSESYSYDDLLTKLRDALSNGSNADELVGRLKKRYPIALVDEFQDTDPIQYEIFNQIYPSDSKDSSQLMIGDPKQAIYTFRGADVYTYLKAKGELHGDIHTLQKNFRSARGLIEGVNALFKYNDNPFLHTEIEYKPSEIGKDELQQNFLKGGNPVSGLHFTIYDKFETNKENLKTYAVHQTAREIAELLEDTSTQIMDESSNEMRSVQPGDIAILVSANAEAERLKRELKKVGLSAVTYSREKVFESFESTRIKLLMESVLDPDNSIKTGNLLISGFWGFDGSELQRKMGEDQFISHLHEQLHYLNEIWYKRGFHAMIHCLLFEYGALQHFSKQPNSERVLTNLFHLADLCSRAEQVRSLSMSELYHWLVDEIQSTEDDDEKTQLLESDQKLIKILTIHTSKGLDFPIVFCPFLWNGVRSEDGADFNEYHDDDNRLVINVDFRKDVNTDAVRKSLIESVAEEVRKTYVAITRAKYQCRIVWGSHTESHLSGMGGVLFGKKFLDEHIDNKLGEKDKQISTTRFIDKISDVQNQYPDYIFLNKIAEYKKRTEPVKLSGESESVPGFEPYNGPEEIHPGRRLDSFSSLNSHGGDASQPDYDQTLDNYVSFLESGSEQKKKKSIFTFPKGATAGTAIHKLFEHEDFEFAAADQTNLNPIAEKVLEQYNYDKKWSGVLQKMMRDVTGSKIDDLVLRNVKKNDEIREMEFHFPSMDLDLGDILNIIRKNTPTDIRESTAQNYLTGFIDLTVRQNGKYYILDYKSNYLGDQVEDYKPEKLKHEIESANYDVQYHIYTVALKKYLMARIPDFDYDRDFGGVAYLFVRGMRTDSDNGVWSVKPKKEVINRLEKYLTSDTKISEVQR